MPEPRTFIKGNRTEGSLSSCRASEPGYEEIGRPDGRRGLWMRVTHSDAGGILVVELAAGREGDDGYVSLGAADHLTVQQLTELEDVLSRLRYSFEIAADQLPKLTITRETSGEVRSVPSVGGCQVIVHPKLDGPGGMQVEIPAKHINRADRLAPGCRLYCYDGVEEYQGRVQGVTVYYAMGSKETFDEARAAMTVGCEVVS